MNRPRLLGHNVDKQWEAERRGAKRAEARLNNGIQEMKDAQSYNINSMTKEQKRLQKDLLRIRQASVTKTLSTTSVRENAEKKPSASERNLRAAPPLDEVAACGASMTLQMRISDFMVGVSSRMGGASDTPESRVVSAARRSSVSSSDTQSVSPAERPASPGDRAMSSAGKTEDPPTKAPAPPYMRRRSSLFRDKALYDEEVYAPDGVLRTRHTMPDFTEALEEARNARYIRHGVRPESEKELSVEEIFPPGPSV